MNKMKLEYSRDWRNPADFPTVEANETKVREDMQALYTEIQSFLNNILIPAIETLEKPTIENLPVENAVSDSKALIPTSYAVSQVLSKNGNLPTGGAAGQILTKTSDAYGDARWATYRIPTRISDLVAVDDVGAPVNAQTLLTEVAKQAKESSQTYLKPVLLSEGILGQGTTVDLVAARRYEQIWITLSCAGRPSLNPAAIYLGAWNGAWLDGEVDDTGMLLLSSAVFPETSSGEVSAEFSLLPAEDGGVVRYMQGMRSDYANYHDGLLIRPVSLTDVPDQTRLTMFSAATQPAGGGADTTVSYRVYGIKRGDASEVI